MNPLYQAELSTKQRILRDAAGLIHLKGFRNTGLSEIMERSRVSKSQLYHYFRDKEDLGHAVLDKFEDVLLGEIFGPVFDSPDPSLTDLCRFFERILSKLREGDHLRGCPVGNIAAEMAGVDENFHAHVTRIFQKVEDKMTGFLEALQEKGEIKLDARPREMAEHFLVVMEGAHLMTKARQDISIFERAMNRLREEFESLRAETIE